MQMLQSFVFAIKSALTYSPAVSLCFYVYDFTMAVIKIDPKSTVFTITFRLNRYQHLCTINICVFNIFDTVLLVQDPKLLEKIVCLNTS